MFSALWEKVFGGDVEQIVLISNEQHVTALDMAQDLRAHFDDVPVKVIQSEGYSVDADVMMEIGDDQIVCVLMSGGGLLGTPRVSTMVMSCEDDEDESCEVEF